MAMGQENKAGRRRFPNGLLLLVGALSPVNHRGNKTHERCYWLSYTPYPLLDIPYMPQGQILCHKRGVHYTFCATIPMSHSRELFMHRVKLGFLWPNYRGRCVSALCLKGHATHRTVPLCSTISRCRSFRFPLPIEFFFFKILEN